MLAVESAPGGVSPASTLPGQPGEVAEWLKALAC
jgi:hypothetical protein